MEKDPDINDGGYTTHYRLLDTRIGRWMSVDPKDNLAPWSSPYTAMANTPILATDVKGDFIPLIVGGIMLLSATEVAVATVGITIAVITHEMVKDLSSQGVFNTTSWNPPPSDIGTPFPKPWTTSRGEAWNPFPGRGPNHPKGGGHGEGNPKFSGPGGGGKWARFLLASGTAAVIAERIYNSYPELDANDLKVKPLDGKNEDVSDNPMIKDDIVFDENNSFINIRVDKVEKLGGKDRVNVTAVGDLIYKMKKGDNLYQISKKTGRSVEQLKEWNDIDDHRNIPKNIWIKVDEVEVTTEENVEN